MSTPNPKVDFFFDKPSPWSAEYAALRSIALATGLTEELKWGAPCYTLNGAHIFLIHGFKEYCALLFMKGALLGDPDRLLVRQTEHVQGPRQIRFTSEAQIHELAPKIKAYIFEAVEVEKAGLKVPKVKAEDLPAPEEWTAALEAQPGLKAAFGKLTPGRQRAYLLLFSAPKTSATRASRIEKAVPRILEGKGPDDR